MSKRKETEEQAEERKRLNARARLRAEQEHEEKTRDILGKAALIFSAVLFVWVIMNLVFFIQSNQVIFEPAYNLIIAICLLVSMIFFLVCKRMEVPALRRNILMAMTVICFLEMVFMFFTVLGLIIT